MTDPREVFKDDGKPDLNPWAIEIARDWSCINHTMRSIIEHGEEPSVQKVAYMLKEARRMESDIRRMAKHAGLNLEEIDNYGPL